ncbi:hypothetical protein EYF80_038027 [Liparis tanakae]|uniref:Uncharacterized protein n=1 Tax=Liparis tanakae TaxID=230148 RepID=A0A4Z2GDS3_9TELE|nr:hypothetical protein EYF80_038027 [Liparis tanakae]
MEGPSLATSWLQHLVQHSGEDRLQNLASLGTRLTRVDTDTPAARGPSLQRLTRSWRAVINVRPEGGTEEEKKKIAGDVSKCRDGGADPSVADVIRADVSTPQVFKSLHSVQVIRRPTSEGLVSLFLGEFPTPDAGLTHWERQSNHHCRDTPAETLSQGAAFNPGRFLLSVHNGILMAS